MSAGQPCTPTLHASLLHLRPSLPSRPLLCCWWPSKTGSNPIAHRKGEVTVAALRVLVRFRQGRQ